MVQQWVHRFDVVLQNSAQLYRLPVGNTDTAVLGMVAGKRVDAQPLARRDNAAGQANTQHHRVQRLQLLSNTLLTEITLDAKRHKILSDHIPEDFPGMTCRRGYTDNAMLFNVKMAYDMHD